MASILEQYFMLAEEGTYNSEAATGYRGIRANADDWAREHAYIDSSDDFYRGKETTRSDSYRKVDMGAGGSLPMCFFDRSMGLILKHLMGQNVAPAASNPVTSPASNVMKFQSFDRGPRGSYTIKKGTYKGIEGATPELEERTYTGCVITNASLSVSNGEKWMFSPTFVASEEALETAVSATTNYPDQTPFYWDETTIEIDDTPVNYFNAFSLDIQNGLDTDIRFLKGTAARDFPTLSSNPQYTGSLDGLYVAATKTNVVDKFVSGDKVKITVKARQAALSQAANALSRALTITLAECIFEGETPKGSTSGLTAVSGKFKVLDDGGAGPAVEIETQNEDTAF